VLRQYGKTMLTNRGLYAPILELTIHTPIGSQIPTPRDGACSSVPNRRSDVVLAELRNAMLIARVWSGSVSLNCRSHAQIWS
jgi:hypothetical protein